MRRRTHPLPSERCEGSTSWPALPVATKDMGFGIGLFCVNFNMGESVPGSRRKPWLQSGGGASGLAADAGCGSIGRSARAVFALRFADALGEGRGMPYFVRLAMGLCGIFFSLCMGAATAESRRVALVIGNAAYKVGPLQNPLNDAAALAEALDKRLRFDKVILKRNL